MSRLIIKNLPNKVTVEQLREIFGQKGEVTDVQLKYTKDGKFRNFGFVGYRSEEQAAAATEHFDGTCIHSMKIQVQPCANLGDEKKPRAWSKYASDSTAYKKLHKDEIEEQENLKRQQKIEKKVEKNKNKIKDLLKKHKDDPLFAEFIEAHTSDKTAWIKNAFVEAARSEDDSGTESVEEKLQTVPDDETELRPEKVADKQITDLEYMKLLMKKVGRSPEREPTANTEQQTPKKIRNRPLHHVKITGLPFKCKKKDLKEFFRPLVPYSIRLPLGKGKKLAGFCYVGFRTEKELNKALIKDKLFLGNHRLHVNKYEDKAKQAAEEEQENYKKKRQEKNGCEETIGESGSIFVRNLPYVLSEVELTALFEKYGPLAEVNVPIDPVLRQGKGFGTVTFVMPEHALRAYSELDGTAFCGRMLHLLPAHTDARDEDAGSDDEGLSFKEKKAKKRAAQAKSSHNWNVVFLGGNAVADVVAARYSCTKEKLLGLHGDGDVGTDSSAAVRLALGETQLVAETKAFLETNGVYLDAFTKTAITRSKTCILVKNLPANTEKEEIKSLFDKFGHIARFLMPPHGISALVDFVEPFEAKKAFGKLAYSQFKHVPLYLEWAPENVFLKPESRGTTIGESEAPPPTAAVEPTSASASAPAEDGHGDADGDGDGDGDEEPRNDTTLFVKNLNFTTTEAQLKSHFSSCGKIRSATVARKKDPKHPGRLLSMGFGFVQFSRPQHAGDALKLLQSSTLDGKSLQLKRSERTNTNEVQTSKKNIKDAKQNGTKILVRNVPFQANRNELHQIFRTFGEIKTLRLPKKLSPGAEQHRGFAFVDYLSKADAKMAFEALCQSTHVYGRRLVLEWADRSDEDEDIALLRKRTADAFNAELPGGKKTRKGAVDADTFVV